MVLTLPLPLYAGSYNTEPRELIQHLVFWFYPEPYTPEGLNYCRIEMKVCMSKLLLQSQPSFTSLSSVAVQNIKEEIYFLNSSVYIRIKFYN